MKRLILKFTVLGALLLSVAGCAKEEKPKYLFYFIGDGMGINIVHGTEHYLAAEKSVDYKDPDSVSFSYFPVMGAINTYSSNSRITDSAAAGTALACGTKTNQGVIGLDSSLENKLSSVAVTAKERGMGVAILTSVSIDHATPAAFYAHNKSRNNYYEIAMDGVTSNFDYFGGSGFKDSEGKKAKGVDVDKNVFDAYSEAGYTILRGKNELSKAAASSSKIVVTERADANQSSFAYEVDRTDKDLKLADLVESATEYLYNNFKEEGFFMMAEGGMIDWAAHSNDTRAAIGEVIDLDLAVEVALEFYRKHPNETLILVTADHETGGYANGYNETGYNLYMTKLDSNLPSIDSYAAEVIASEAEDFDQLPLPGDYQFSQEQLHFLEDKYSEIVKNHRKTSGRAGMYSKANSEIATIIYRMISGSAGAGWTTMNHTGSPVPVFAIGPGAQNFAGHKDNTEIPQIMKSLLEGHLQN